MTINFSDGVLNFINCSVVCPTGTGTRGLVMIDKMINFYHTPFDIPKEMKDICDLKTKGILFVILQNNLPSQKVRLVAF